MKKELLFGFLTFVSGLATAFIQGGNPQLALVFALFAVFFLGMFIILLFRSNRAKYNVDVNKHPFWNRMDYFVKYKIPSIAINNGLRKKLFVEALTVQFNVIHKRVQEFMSTSFNDCQAKNLLIDIVLEYEREWKLNNVPEIFVVKFHEFHSPRLVSIIHYIEFICTSTFYPDESDKKIAILDGILLMMQWILLDIEQADKAVNGRLTEKLQELRNNGQF